MLNWFKTKKITFVDIEIPTTGKCVKSGMLLEYHIVTDEDIRVLLKYTSKNTREDLNNFLRISEGKTIIAVVDPYNGRYELLDKQLFIDKYNILEEDI